MKYFQATFNRKFTIKDFERLHSLLKGNGVKISFNILNLVNQDLLEVEDEYVNDFKACFRKLEGINLTETVCSECQDLYSVESFKLTYEDGWSGGQFFIEKDGVKKPYSLDKDDLPEDINSFSIEVQNKKLQVYPHKIHGSDYDHGKVHHYTLHTAVFRSGMLLNDFLQIAESLDIPVMLNIYKIKK